MILDDREHMLRVQIVMLLKFSVLRLSDIVLQRKIYSIPNIFLLSFSVFLVLEKYFPPPNNFSPFPTPFVFSSANNYFPSFSSPLLFTPVRKRFLLQIHSSLFFSAFILLLKKKVSFSKYFPLFHFLFFFSHANKYFPTPNTFLHFFLGFSSQVSLSMTFSSFFQYNILGKANQLIYILSQITRFAGSQEP